MAHDFLTCITSVDACTACEALDAQYAAQRTAAMVEMTAALTPMQRLAALVTGR